MAFRPDRKFIIHMMQRNRRRRDATLNPPDGVLGWVTPPLPLVQLMWIILSFGRMGQSPTTYRFLKMVEL